jgi:hypothetical protein
MTMVEISRDRSGVRRRGRGLRRDERGTAVVEAGLVTMFLAPLLMGVLWFGNYFWHQQSKDTYAPRVSQSQLVGNYLSCEELVSAVRQTAVVNLNNVSGNSPVSLDNVTARVIDFVPNQLGVEVEVSVRVPAARSAVSWLLPHGGDLVTESMTRLENVRVTSQTC